MYPRPKPTIAHSLSGQVWGGRMGNVLRALRHGTHPPSDRCGLSPAAGAPAHVGEVLAAVCSAPEPRWVDRLLHVSALFPPDIDDAAAPISAPSPAWNRDDVL
jgi:hypothetical protein